MKQLSASVSHRRLSGFLAELGWKGLEMNRVPTEIQGTLPFRLMEYLFTIGEMDDPLYLQVNPLPLQHPRLYGVAVYAAPYRVCSGWHGLRLVASKDEMARQRERLHGWIGRENFESADARRTYRRLHNECSGYSWRRIRDEGGPYYRQETCLERCESWKSGGAPGLSDDGVKW